MEAIAMLYLLGSPPQPAFYHKDHTRRPTNAEEVKELFTDYHFYQFFRFTKRKIDILIRGLQLPMYIKPEKM